MESNHSVGQEGLMSIKVVKNPWTDTQPMGELFSLLDRHFTLITEVFI